MKLPHQQALVKVRKKRERRFFSKIKKGIRNGVKGLFGVSIMAPNIAVGSVATIPDTAKETYKGLKDRWSKVAESDKWYKKGAKALSTLTLGTGIEAVYGLGRYVRNNIKFLFNTNPAGSAIKEYWGVKKEEKSNGDSEKK